MRLRLFNDLILLLTFAKMRVF